MLPKGVDIGLLDLCSLAKPKKQSCQRETPELSFSAARRNRVNVSSAFAIKGAARLCDKACCLSTLLRTKSFLSSNLGFTGVTTSFPPLFKNPAK